MSFEGDAPMRTMCPGCDCWVETEGYGIPAWVMDKDHTVYHARCHPDLCIHERRTVRDWKETASGGLLVHYKCRDCDTSFSEEGVPFSAERRAWMIRANDLLLNKGISRFDTGPALQAYSRGESPEEFVNEITAPART